MVIFNSYVSLPEGNPEVMSTLASKWGNTNQQSIFSSTKIRRSSCGGQYVTGYPRVADGDGHPFFLVGSVIAA
jgi:hypothetical protein